MQYKQGPSKNNILHSIVYTVPKSNIYILLSTTYYLIQYFSVLYLQTILCTHSTASISLYILYSIRVILLQMLRSLTQLQL